MIFNPHPSCLTSPQLEALLRVNTASSELQSHQAHHETSQFTLGAPTSSTASGFSSSTALGSPTKPTSSPEPLPAPQSPVETFCSESEPSKAAESADPILSNPGLVIDDTPRPRMHVDKRSSTSRRTKLFQQTLKFTHAERIIKPGKPEPFGSPVLKPPEFVYEKCVVQQRQLGDVPVKLYDINPRSKAVAENFIAPQLADLDLADSVAHNASPHLNHALAQIQSHELHDIRSRDFAALPSPGTTAPLPRRKHIYFFSGGAFQSVPSVDHWKLCTHLCTELNQRGHPATISVVSYPLAPSTPALASLDLIAQLYQEILPSSRPGAPTTTTTPSTPSTLPTSPLLSPGVDARYTAPAEEVIFAGDSSGGCVVLSTLLHVLGSDPYARPPSQCLLICPALDLREPSAETREAAKHAPMVSLPFTRMAADAWLSAPGTNADDPRISPLLGDLKPLAEGGVKLHGIVAGYDVLGPEARALRRKAAEAGVGGCWLDWEGMMHCFPLAFSYVGGRAFPEAPAAVEWMIQVLIGKIGADE